MRHVWWLLVLLLVLGGAYRIAWLGDGAYWIDESYTVLAAKNIGSYGIPAFDSGASYFRAWPQSYALFAIGSVFGYGHIAMRILSVIAGTAFIGLVFIFLRKRYGDTIALLTAALVAFSHYQIAWSRQARMYIFVEVLVFLSLYLYLEFLEKHTWRSALWLLVAILATIIFHTVGILLVLVMIVHYAITLLPQKGVLGLKRVVQDLNAYALAAGLIIATLIAYYAFHSLRVVTLSDYSEQYVRFFFQAEYFLIFMAVVGLFCYKRYWKENLLYALTFGLVFAVAAHFIFALNFRYTFIVMPIVYLFASQAIVYLYDRYRSAWYRAVIVIATLAIVMVSGFVSLPAETYTLEPGTPQPPFAEAYAAVDGSQTLIVSQPAIAELYLRKPDYWLVYSYSSAPVETEGVYNISTRKEVYTNTTGVMTGMELWEALTPGAYVVVDDMAMQRIDVERRTIIQNLTLIGTYGTEYWSTVYVYKNE